ncbi:MAG: DUF4147 domain-containing protein [Gammaproteobacteria bacterium]|nr:DUF4147 domain-containing protein [Gammaproteobacteria bacterium]
MVHGVATGDHRALLERLFAVGVESCKPQAVMPAVLPEDAPAGRNIVLGAGKAAAEMAAVAVAHLKGVTDGLVVTRYGHGTEASTGNVEVIEAGHPVPDTQSSEAATRMLEIAKSATANDRVLFMMSGGGSALLCSPIDGVTIQQKREITRFMLHSGAPIDEINLVRKRLSKIKGGGLASNAAPAELRTYVISDVVGDNPSDVASGPSLATTQDADTAIAVLEKYGFTMTADLATAMRQAEKPNPSEHPVYVLATAKTALDAVVAAAKEDGWSPIIVGENVEGDAADIGRQHAGVARQYLKTNERVALISGGELTVRVRNRDGKGGPNLEYLAGLMIQLNGEKGIEAIACDSDGIDGSQDNAGGYISPTSTERAAEKDVDVASLLANNNTYECFAALGDLIVTGPTRTNVNDIRVILVDPARETH